MMTLVEIQAQNQLGEGSIAVGEESEYQWQRETGATDEQIVRYVFFTCTTISWPTQRSFLPNKARARRINASADRRARFSLIGSLPARLTKPDRKSTRLNSSHVA